MDFPCFVIHRSQDVEREDIVIDLEKQFPTLKRFEAIDGKEVYDIPRWSGHAGSMVSDGNVGNTLSHYTLLRQCDEDYIGIFEDDAVVIGNYKPFVEQHKDADILYLGVLEVVDGDLQDDYHIVKSSWGTHAVIVNKTGMQAICKTFMNGLQEGIFYPADWLYNRAIKDFDLKAVAPATSLVIQKKGLVSYISGSVRT